ncbi:alpha/beta hydrolase [Vibrio salinus]|uniref:alpha/beta hydrolase n=1 Tax=Vibrio salinus TaxID=2899784 RepID=UPI001E505785|nr:alpha/beta hydrolase [Vibrio salinus]MCE0495541.1 alpha/beta hydrolase [Vibrio salinus]
MSKSPTTPFIEPVPLSFNDFPESQLTADEMNIIEADNSGLYCQTEKIRYAVKSDMPLHLNLISPLQDEENKQKMPLILYVQGSAWLSQNLESKIVQLGKMSERGFIVAIVQYRPSEVAAFPAQIKDVKTAYRFLTEHADRYNIDSEQIVLWGDSSGGHTVTMMALTADNPEFNDECHGKQPIKIKAVIDYYGPVDISKMNEEPSTVNHTQPESPEGLLIGGLDVIDHPETAQKTNPLNYINKEINIPPFLIFHGNKDRLVPFGQSVMLYNALKQAEKAAKFYQIKGADHGRMPFWSSSVLNIVERFIRNNLQNSHKNDKS